MHVYEYATPVATGTTATARSLVARTSWAELNANITIAQRVRRSHNDVRRPGVGFNIIIERMDILHPIDSRSWMHQAQYPLLLPATVHCKQERLPRRYECRDLVHNHPGRDVDGSVLPSILVCLRHSFQYLVD